MKQKLRIPKNKGKGGVTRLRVFGTILAVAAAFWAYLLIFTTNYNHIQARVIVLAILVAIGSFLCFFFAHRREANQKTQADTNVECVAARQIPAAQKAEDPSGYIAAATHIDGLPLADGMPCDVVFNARKLIVQGGGTSFELPYGRITDMRVVSDTEFNEQYVSSIGGAVGGAMLFGTLGAMIGGRAKRKVTTIRTHYLLISYTREGALYGMSFEVYKPWAIQSEIRSLQQFMPQTPTKIKL